MLPTVYVYNYASEFECNHFSGDSHLRVIEICVHSHEVVFSNQSILTRHTDY